MKVRIFTDGACSDNPGPGGWAAVLNENEGHKIIKGNESSTTNNRMELKAVVESLKKILSVYSNHYPIPQFELYSDSAYVINAINCNWIEKWKLNGWKTTKHEDVKNRDLWEEFYSIREKLRSIKISIVFIKVKGHSGNTFNEMVDKLAKQQTEVAKRKNI